MDLSDRTFIVTGASSGLGAETARVLARAGGRVILACRDPGRARAAVVGAIGGDTEIRTLDLADLSSVRRFVDGVDVNVDVLINNAGVMAVPYGTTVDGFETHLGVNHLGPFALTGLLLDRVRDRVVTVTSGLHRLGRLDLDDLNWTRRRYRRWLAYAQSKLANLLFAYELDRRIRSVAAHPGVAATEGMRRDTSLTGRVLAGGRAQPVEMGALPIVYAATADLPGGVCVGPDGFAQRTGYPRIVGTSRRSRDAALATRLWDRSERLTGVSWPAPG